ncbi:MAG TPA: hypothetical protein PKC03_13840 [Dokdonella sp.]|nr:hypothetical protein [Dokdonella sp.]
MKRTRSRVGVFLLLAGAVCTMPSGAQSTGGPYRIDPAVIAAGGGKMAGGSLQISSTIGQPATALLAGAGYTLQGGFWSAAESNSDSIFANGFDN